MTRKLFASTRCWFVSGCIAFALVGGCGDRRPEPNNRGMPAVEMTIPDDLPVTVIVTEKDGTQREVKARELYALAYRQGWEECWQLYRSAKIALDDEQAAPTPHGEYGFLATARRSGFQNCRLKVLELTRDSKAN